MRAINTWLLRRMYFDELYNFVFVSIVMGFSAVLCMVRQVDHRRNREPGRVDREAGFVYRRRERQIRRRWRGERRRNLAQDLGAAVRAPQTGRIRMYVTVLMIAVTLGLAGAIIVVLSR